MASKTAQPAKTHTIRPVKAANLLTATQHAAAYSAFRSEWSAKPTKAEWNGNTGIVQQIGLSAGYLRVPYTFANTVLLAAWTDAYKAAVKGHVVGKPIAPKPPKAVQVPTQSKGLYTDEQVAAAVSAAVAAAMASLTK